MRCGISRRRAFAQGGHYTYTVKATYKGKEVTKKLNLGHGSTNSFDLRPDFQEDDRERTTIGSKPAQAKRPNIVILMTDDTGWGTSATSAAAARRWGTRRRTSIASPKKERTSPVGMGRRVAPRADVRS